MSNECYTGNLGAFSPEELAAIRTKSICVVGCGGLGGYTAHALARFGVAALTLVDGDCFTESNRNRQMFALPETMGQNKAEAAARALTIIDSALTVTPVGAMLSEDNAVQILGGHDLVIDCLDRPQARLVLESACAQLNIPFVHGAIDGFFGQAAVVLPGDALMQRLYGNREPVAATSSPVFTVQAVSAIQCCEALKLLAGRPSPLQGKLLHINLEDNVWTTLAV